MDHGAPLGAWGETPSGRVLDPRTEAFARARLGEPLGAPDPSETAGRIAGRTAADDPALTPERMRALFPGVEWSLDASMRARFSRGMSYLNLMSWRAGEAARLPDAVVFPASHEHVLEVLAACSAQGIAVVPVGGGTSVTGGVDTPDLDTAMDAAFLHAQAFFGPNLTGGSVFATLNSADNGIRKTYGNLGWIVQPF